MSKNRAYTLGNFEGDDLILSNGKLIILTNDGSLIIARLALSGGYSLALATSG